MSTDKPVKAMILAAGRGERMRPLTDNTPKPLLAVRGKPLLDWHLEALAHGGFHELVINTDWLGEQIPAHLSKFSDSSSNSNLDQQDSLQPQPLLPLPPPLSPLSISYSHEGIDFGSALETAGGIARALPLLGDIFWVLAGDVFMPGFVFSETAVQRFEASGKLAHLWLVPNPPHNPQGDFGLSPEGLALNLAGNAPRNAPHSNPQEKFTFSTVALYRRDFFRGLPFGNPDGIKAPLAPMLRLAMDNEQVSAELYEGPWTDVGTPARLHELNQITRN